MHKYESHYFCDGCGKRLMTKIESLYFRIRKKNYPTRIWNGTSMIKYDFLRNSYYLIVMPKKIIFNGPATIVIWDDGTKTVVKQSKYDNYDYEKGFAMCVVKRIFGDKRNAIRKMIDEAYGNEYRETIQTIS